MIIATATSTKLLIAAPIGVVVIVVLLRLLVRLDQSPTRVRLVTLIMGLVIVESILYAQNETPVGLFHPQLGSQNFRLYDLLIPLALVARLRSRGMPKRSNANGFIWIAFFAWYVVCGIVGHLDGNSFTNISFEAKSIIYLGGSMALVSGYSVEELLGPHGPLRLIKPFSVVCAIVGALGIAHVSINIPVPGIDVTSLEGIPSDAASVLIILAVLGFVIELSRPKRSPTVLIGCAVIAISTLTSGQRAALVQLVISGLIVAVAWLLPSARRRVSFTPTQVLVVVLVLGAVLIAPSLAARQSPFAVKSLPFGSKIEQTLGSESKAQSAQERVNQLDQVKKYGPERLLTGWGLGRTITYYATGTYLYSTIDITHDIATDLVLRGGLVALGLFVAGSFGIIGAGLFNWRRHPDDIIAAASLACSAILVGLLGKGLVESIFEKYRVAVGLGLALGIARALLTAPKTPMIVPDGSPAVPGSSTATPLDHATPPENSG